MLKRCKVVMLPTNQEATIFKILNIDKLCLGANEIPTYENRHQNQHLYILSDEEQQVGDFGLLKGANRVSIRTPDCGKAYDFQKVIATTDTSLNLPQPSQAFIEKYVDLYNKGQQIEKVDVEYNEPCCKCDTNEKWVECCYAFYDECTAPNPNDDFYGLKPKVSNNTITIRKIKDSYTREEVVLLLLDFGEFVLDNSILPNRKSVQEWLEKNL